MGFGYPLGTALAVGLNLSQIGEFVFVLLSVANQQSLLPESVYMLLMGERAAWAAVFVRVWRWMSGWLGGERNGEEGRSVQAGVFNPVLHTASSWVITREAWLPCVPTRLIRRCRRCHRADAPRDTLHAPNKQPRDRTQPGPPKRLKRR